MWLVVTIAIGVVSFLLYFLRRPQKPFLEKPLHEAPLKEPLPQKPSLGNVVVYFGTQTGKSESLAKEFADELRQNNYNPVLTDLENFDLATFKSHKFCVIIISTQGQGEPPQSAKGFYNIIRNAARKQSEDLSSLEYSLFGVGASSYGDLYNIAAIRLNNFLKKLQAKDFLELKLGDEDKNLEEDFQNWKTQLLKLIPQKVNPSVQVTHKATQKVTKNYSKNAKLYLESKDLQVLSMKELKNDPEFYTLHIELEAKDLEYKTAWNLGMFPENEPQVVEQVALSQGYDLDTQITQDSVQGETLPFPVPCSLREAFQKYLDFTSLPRKVFIKKLAQYAHDPLQKEELLNFCSIKGKNAFVEHIEKPMLGLADLLTKYDSIKVPLDEFLAMVPMIQPRYYTIASSSLLHPDSVHLTFSITKEDTTRGPRFGLCSGFVWRMFENSTYRRVRAFVKESVFKPNYEGEVVMVATGSGIAPFRGILQECSFLKQQGKPFPNLTLYYGVKKESHFLYKEEFDQLIARQESTDPHQYVPTTPSEQPLINKCYLAYSQTEPKTYVQHVLSKHTEVLRKVRTGQLLGCGNVKMGQAIPSLFESQASEENQDPKELLKWLRENNKLLIEVW